MTITIPDTLTIVVFHLFLWPLLLLLLAESFLLTTRKIKTALINRNTYWTAIVWLTTQKQRADATRWTLTQFGTLKRNLQKENPQFLKEIQNLFSDQGAYTYTSTQATDCAVCGQYKHTPLRNDKMGGYVCLMCVDKELERLQATSPQNQP